MSNIQYVGQFVLRAVIPAVLVAAMVCAPITGCNFLSDLQKVEQQIPVVETIITTITGVAAPEYLPAVTAAITALQGGLSVIDKIIQQYKSSKTMPTNAIVEVDNALLACQSQLVYIMALAHVTDPEKQKVVTAAIGAADIVLKELAILFPPKVAAGNPTIIALQNAAENTGVKIRDKSYVIAQFNAGQNRVTVTKAGFLQYR